MKQPHTIIKKEAEGFTAKKWQADTLASNIMAALKKAGYVIKRKC